MNPTSEKRDIKGEAQHDGATPVYLSTRPDGVFVDLNKLSSVGGFEVFVDRLFGGDYRFSGLDYAHFQKLLFDADWLEAVRRKTAEVKIATAIVRFPEQRRELYKSVKLLAGGKRAEYLFEPVTLEEPADEAAPEAEAEGDGNVVELRRHAGKTKRVPATLDLDEFVADVWAKGVKFGIDVDGVRKVLAAHTTTRLEFAHFVPETNGKDAAIQEVCSDLRRDDTPRTLVNGKADLRAFKNRFPHVSKGGKLFKKIPRVMGKPGHLITGEVIEPPVPKDIDFAALTSRGTAVSQGKDGEFIVALMDGFVTIDTASNVISVSEKIETDAGISMKTTGDLALVVDEFIEHGDVQEGRVVHGRNMTFTGDVFGELISSGGNIRVEGNANGARTETADGNITLNLAFKSVVLAPTGTVTAKYCENCTIVAKSVVVERAVNCDIVGGDVRVEVTEGCSIAAESVSIVKSSESRAREMLITMLLPDLSEFDKGIAELQKKVTACTASRDNVARQIAPFEADSEFMRYLAIDGKRKSGEIKLTDTQMGPWKHLVAKNAETLAKWGGLQKQASAFERLIHESEEQIAKLVESRNGAGTHVGCDVEQVIGQTIGQSMRTTQGVKEFAVMTPVQLRSLLHSVDAKRAGIFSASDGTIKWRYK